MIHPACDELTPRQYQLWDFLRRENAAGRSPTFAATMECMGNKYTNGVSDVLKVLARKGYIARQHGRTGIRLRCREVSIPVLAL